MSVEYLKELLSMSDDELITEFKRVRLPEFRSDIRRALDDIGESYKKKDVSFDALPPEPTVIRYKNKGWRDEV